jgi:hypothetical protein
MNQLDIPDEVGDLKLFMCNSLILLQENINCCYFIKFYFISSAIQAFL